MTELVVPDWAGRIAHKAHELHKKHCKSPIAVGVIERLRGPLLQVRLGPHLLQVRHQRSAERQDSKQRFQRLLNSFVMIRTRCRA